MPRQTRTFLKSKRSSLSRSKFTRLSLLVRKAVRIKSLVKITKVKIVKERAERIINHITTIRSKRITKTAMMALSMLRKRRSVGVNAEEVVEDLVAVVASIVKMIMSNAEVETDPKPSMGKRDLRLKLPSRPLLLLRKKR